MNRGFPRRLLAEGLGTAALLTVVVGSGIMGEALAKGNDAVALLANSLATGCGLTVLILTLGPVSGAHFNPAVSLVAALDGGLRWTEAGAYCLVQFAGAVVGVAMAHMMFALPIITASVKARTGPAQWLAEAVATFGLVAAIQGCARQPITVVCLAIGAYITSAYWFTASTSFANPAVTFARSLTDTFAGIRLSDAPAFMAAQLIGAMAGLCLAKVLWPKSSAS